MSTWIFEPGHKRDDVERNRPSHAADRQIDLTLERRATDVEAILLDDLERTGAIEYYRG